jgi:DNA repair photolyase
MLVSDEIRELFQKAKDAKIAGVVTGSLRVTESILNRLRAANIPLEALERSLKGIKLGKKQIPVPDHRSKEIARITAAELGLEYLPSACAANVKSHKMGCALCRFGPCGTPPSFSSQDVEEFLEILGMKGHASLSGDAIRIELITWNRKRMNIARIFLSEVYKRKVFLKGI